MDIVRPKVAWESMVVIYDPESGQVLHRHEVVSTEGAKHPDEKTIESDAWDELERSRPDLRERAGELRGRLAILHADPKTIKPGRIYRVDTRARTLVEHERQRP